MKATKFQIPILIDSVDENGHPFPNIDIKYGPYDSIESAKETLADYLVKGLTVAIIENGIIVEYWIEDDTLEFVKKDKDTKIQSDWNENDENSSAFIKNKPNLSSVATSGSYDDLSDKPTIPTVDLSGYKTKQIKKQIQIPDDKIIDYIEQNNNGEVTCNFQDIPVANKNTFGFVKTSSDVDDNTGLTPCPIIDGIPYYETINLTESNNYITIIGDNFIEQLYYKKQNSENIFTYHINFPRDRIIFYRGTKICNFCSDNGTILGTLIPGNFYITKSSDYKANDLNDEPKTVVWGECINLEYQTNGYNKLDTDVSIDYTKDVIEIHDSDSDQNIELPFNYPTDKMLKGKHIKIFYFNDNPEVNKKLTITSTDSKCYIVGDSSTIYDIPREGRCIIIEVYILDKNLIINVTQNINKLRWT